MVLSEALSNRLWADPGTETALPEHNRYAPGVNAIYRPSDRAVLRFVVVTRFNKFLKGDVIYIDISAAQRLFNMRNEVTGYDLKLKNTDDANAVKSELQEILGPEYSISSWYDLQRPLYDVMAFEKWGSYIILMLIIFVAALNIVGSLTMIVLQKRKDIGILRSMGMTQANIKKVYSHAGSTHWRDWVRYWGIARPRSGARTAAIWAGKALISVHH